MVFLIAFLADRAAVYHFTIMKVRHEEVFGRDCISGRVNFLASICSFSSQANIALEVSWSSV